VVIIGTGFIAVPTGKQQAAWIDASQKRVAATSHVLGSIKSLRLSGLNEYAFNFLEKLRIKELEVSRKFRLLLSIALMLCKLSNYGFLVLVRLTPASHLRSRHKSRHHIHCLRRHRSQ
jgi:hypothetical protein